MKVRKIFNLESLVSVEIYDKHVCYCLTYEPFKKSFWGNTKAGFYSILSIESGFLTKEEVERGVYNDIPLIVENNVVYFRPYVELTFASGTNHIREFNDYESAIEWGEQTASKGIKVQLRKDDK